MMPRSWIRAAAMIGRSAGGPTTAPRIHTCRSGAASVFAVALACVFSQERTLACREYNKVAYAAAHAEWRELFAADMMVSPRN